MTILSEICSTVDGLQTVILPKGSRAPATITREGDQVKFLIGREAISWAYNGKYLTMPFNVPMLTDGEVKLLKKLLKSHSDCTFGVISDLVLETSANNSGSICLINLIDTNDFSKQLFVSPDSGSGSTRLVFEEAMMLTCIGSRCGLNSLPPQHLTAGPFILRGVRGSLTGQLPFNLEWSRMSCFIQANSYKIEIAVPGICEGMLVQNVFDIDNTYLNTYIHAYLNTYLNTYIHT